MSLLRSSPNYIWNTNAVLGKGATGAVFAGLHKQTGDAVAVKAFNHLSHMRPYEVQKREFEVLKKVNHQNIVKLLAIEEENESHHKVLVMELCTGGSLFNILDDPINYYGLDEKEFLLVLKHVAAGMKHLRDMNIIHRDLKPGNIMKYVCEDHTSIYKLTDFGAARELEDDQQFMSLYGTEEYLHPDMYERAVLRKSVGKSFNANVDLWSIGVTLYHIATGVLPFRPYGGRKNKDTMYKITTGKSSGIISGVQNTENGEIEWSRTLPKSCLLTNSLQPLVTQLLAGLLECDESRMWSFDKFFKSVTNILTFKTIHIFYANNLSLHCLYCYPNEKLIEIKTRLETMVKLGTGSQLMIWNKKQISDDLTVNDFQTSADKPIFLLNSDSTKIRATYPSTIQTSSSSSSSSSTLTSAITTSATTAHKFPDIINTSTNCETDAQMAKLCASMAYSIQRCVDKSALNHRLANETPTNIMSLIENNVKRLTEKQQKCQFMLNSLNYQLDSLNENNLIINRLVSSLHLDIDNTIINEEVAQLYQKLLQDWTGLSSEMTAKVNNLRDNWIKESQNSSAYVSSAQSKAKYFCNKIRESWQTLHKDKQSRALNLSVNEEKLHQLEKIKMDTNCKKLNDVLIKESNAGITIMTEKLDDWYSGAQVAIVQSECLLNVITGSFMTDLNNLNEMIDQIKEDQRQVWQTIIKRLQSIAPKTTTSADPTHQLLDLPLTANNQPIVYNNLVVEQQQQQQSEVQSNESSSSNQKLPPILAQELDSLRESAKAVWLAMQENISLTAELNRIDMNHWTSTLPPN
ncbi:serine/threonine-protein kinase TBK1-like [Oppia nitens]|uniref:serine/threonine-protein kinase TBK1-like n=1 Tax=Oppia nitens TaxID=1686743 RepID=UPI0023DBB0C0|nr:serine/threonine-protein kinase TBK1-like [Oppia nitens]